MLTKRSNRNPYTVTTVPDVQKDYNTRMKKYTIIMLIRFACIALALLIPFPWNIAPIIFAVFSPWFAVLIANNKKVETPTIEQPTKQIAK